MDTILQHEAGICPQGSVTGRIIRRELGLQPEAVVSGRTGAQTNKMKTDRKTTRGTESPDLPGVMLLSIATLPHFLIR